jgi:leucyl/phenylalanyl-tRNA--protein transferase
LRKGDFEVTWNAAFSQVIRSCGSGRREGTWILPEVIAAYEQLHRRGDAHSLEVWQTGKLVGGLYGVQRGALFAAESMFHRATDMSKVALLYAVSTLSAAGIELLDVQFLTPHLESLGAVEITRGQYLEKLRTAVNKAVSLRVLEPRSPLAPGS